MSSETKKIVFSLCTGLPIESLKVPFLIMSKVEKTICDFSGIRRYVLGKDNESTIISAVGVLPHL